MDSSALLVVLLVLLAPPLVLIGLGLWARWLGMRTTAPRWLVYPPATLPAVVYGFGVLVGILRATGALGGRLPEPGRKASMLGEGISEAMNCTAVAMVLAVLAVAWLLGLTWKYRWSLNRAP